MDRSRAEGAVREFLAALGRDPDDAELRETPARVVAAWGGELLAGYSVDLAALLREGALPCGESARAELVAVRGIQVATLCPHHLLPALGQGTVVFRPGTALLGVGVVARLLRACSQRLVLQENVGTSVVSALLGPGGATGAYCRLELRHTCLAVRGEREGQASVLTSAAGGDLVGPDAERELTLLLGGARHHADPATEGSRA